MPSYISTILSCVRVRSYLLRAGSNTVVETIAYDTQISLLENGFNWRIPGTLTGNYWIKAYKRVLTTTTSRRRGTITQDVLTFVGYAPVNPTGFSTWLSRNPYVTFTPLRECSLHSRSSYIFCACRVHAHTTIHTLHASARYLTVPCCGCNNTTSRHAV